MENTLIEAPTTRKQSRYSPASELPAHERALQRKYTRSTESQPVDFEFTRDPALLHQYYILREQMFISVWGLKKFYGGKDEFDDVNDTLIARQGRLCVGGARFTFSTPEKPVILPMENSNWRLIDLFPEFNLENKIYGEVGRFALLPEFSNREVSRHMQDMVCWQHILNHASYGFWIAPLAAARHYRQTVTNLGYKCTIRTDITVPDREEFESIKMYVGVMDFTRVNSGHADAPAHQKESA